MKYDNVFSKFNPNEFLLNYARNETERRRRNTGRRRRRQFIMICCSAKTPRVRARAPGRFVKAENTERKKTNTAEEHAVGGTAVIARTPSSSQRGARRTKIRRLSGGSVHHCYGRMSVRYRRPVELYTIIKIRTVL